MQHAASIHQHAIDGGTVVANPLEKSRVTIDISGRRHPGFPHLRIHGPDVLLLDIGGHPFEPRTAMAVERSATTRAQVVKQRETVLVGGVIVRHALKWHE